MYLDYWQFRRKPFENTPDPEFFFPAPEHSEALERLDYAVRENKGAALLTGDYGCGKTMLVRRLAFSVPEDRFEVAYLNNPRWTPVELLQDILFQLGEEEIPNTSIELGRKLNELLFRNIENGKDTLVIIDEAQLIQSEAVLEELRLLLNFQLNDRFMVTLLMCGQPELRERIIAIPQLEQRMFVKYHLHSFDINLTRSYIEHRLNIAGVENHIFTPDAVEAIYRHSFGTPRRINNICDLCLLVGFQKKTKIINASFVESLI